MNIFLFKQKAKSESELRHLREEVASLRGNLKRQAEEKASARNQLKIKKKLAEQENELTLQSSKLKLIIRENVSLQATSGGTGAFYSSSFSHSSSTNTSTGGGGGGGGGAGSISGNSGGGGFFSNANSLTSALSTSMNNLANLTLSGQLSKHNAAAAAAGSANLISSGNYQNGSTAAAGTAGGGGSALNSNSNNSFNQSSYASSNTFVFLFTSDFERNSWLEEINAAIYACKYKFFAFDSAVFFLLRP
jgi:hypothetical protein